MHGWRTVKGMVARQAASGGKPQGASRMLRTSISEGSNIVRVKGWHKAQLLATAAKLKLAKNQKAQKLQGEVAQQIIRDVAKDTAAKVREASQGTVSQVLAAARVRYKAREIRRKALRMQRRIRRRPEVAASLHPTTAVPTKAVVTMPPEPHEPLSPSSVGDTYTQGVAALRGGSKVLAWLDQELRAGDRALDLTRHNKKIHPSGNLARNTVVLNRRVKKMAAALRKKKAAGGKTLVANKKKMGVSKTPTKKKTATKKKTLPGKPAVKKVKKKKNLTPLAVLMKAKQLEESNVRLAPSHKN